jgi:phosphate transport system protein
MRRLDIKTEEMNQRLLEMGALVASSVARSARSLIEKSEVLAHQVIRDEARLNQMEIQIDDLATSMIVLTQPVASDMRFVTVAIKINTDLERMGDLAVGIVERSLTIMHQPAIAGIAGIGKLPEMAQLVESMVLKSLDSFVKRDAELAGHIIRSDDSVDNIRNEIAQELIGVMKADTDLIPRALDLLIIARHLERIADHATSVAENVIFLVKGQDVRHVSHDALEADNA